MHKNLRWNLLSVVLALTLTPPAFAGFVTAKFRADDLPKLMVSGKVTDSHGLPVKGAKLTLIDMQSRERVSGKTDKDGHFEISHEPGKTEALQVIPPAKTGLAQAIITNIPGDEGRHVLVSLKPGLWVTGRVVSSGYPLKGVRVKVIGRGNDAMHDGGEAQTNGRGQYALSVTPGEKVFEVSEVRDSAVIGLHRQKHRVTTGGALPDIEVPPSQTAGIEQ